MLVRQLPGALPPGPRGGLDHTQDFELDIVVLADGTWALKDLELMPERVEERHLTQDVADKVVRLGEALRAKLRRVDTAGTIGGRPGRRRQTGATPSSRRTGTRTRRDPITMESWRAMTALLADGM